MRKIERNVDEINLLSTEDYCQEDIAVMDGTI